MRNGELTTYAFDVLQEPLVYIYRLFIVLKNH